MPKTARKTTQVFDPCNQPQCNHSWGKKQSQTQWRGNTRDTMRTIVVWFQNCTNCGATKWL